MDKSKVLPIKEKIGVESFALGDVIGEGAYSKVFIARMKTTSNYYAVKRLNKTFITKEKKEEAVRAERDALTIVDHPFIVHLYYTFQDSQNLYFVLTLCRGGSMWDVLKTLRLPGRGCDPTLIRFYLAEIISAINYLHNTAHLIHRDLKPENILISESGHIMVTDFGTITTNSERTRRNTMCGTILYLAPETIHGESITSAVDIWSIGCMFYLLFTGCFIFEGENELNVIESIDHFCVDLLEFPDYVPEDARDLIRHMLDISPSSRITAKQAMEHPYFEGIDFTTLSSQIPPFVPPYEPLPVIRDNPLENELINFRYSIDESYRDQERLVRDAVERLLEEEEKCRYASSVVHVYQSEKRKRELVLTSKSRLVIMDSQIISIKSVILPTQISDVVVNSEGFSIKVHSPRKIKFRFLTPEMNEAVWYNCIQWLMRQAKEKGKVVDCQL